MATALPKLTYFNGRGRAELARLIFAAAEVQYEDVRIGNIAEHKGTGFLPFDQLPILEIDGFKLAQSAGTSATRGSRRDRGGFGGIRD